MFNPSLETENDNPPGPDGCRSHDVKMFGKLFSFLFVLFLCK